MTVWGWAAAVLVLVGCAATSDTSDDTTSTGGHDASGGGGSGGSPTSGGGPSAGGSGGFETVGGSGGGTPAEGEVYGHSDTQLFKLEPIAKVVTVVGTFDCVSITFPGSGEGMWDIAIDKDGRMVGTLAKLENFVQNGALVEIDEVNAHCSVIATGVYPNSLTFVPAGTLDPTNEVLVGFNGAAYLQIDPTTGAQTPIGNLNPNPTGQDWESSGDVVSIIGDKTYLTVKPLGSGSMFAGSDNIVEIDPLTGQALDVIGDTTYPKLWGLGYWGGTAYGFSATGQLAEISLTDGSATGIPVMNAPPGLAWWGAGVTTSAPIEPPQ
jgi:hypothetical protein